MKKNYNKFEHKLFERIQRMFKIFQLIENMELYFWLQLEKRHLISLNEA